MRLGPPTPPELRVAFGRIMGDLRAGRAELCPTGLGFDTQTMAAINAFAADQTAVLAANAQAALSQQVAGLHRTADNAALQQLLEES